MPDKPEPNLTSGLQTEQLEFTLDDLCAACGVSQAQIKAYISEGIIEPQTWGESQWRFSSVSLLVTRKAGRLERDLGLNPAGVALALELMEEVESLRHRLAHFESRTPNADSDT